jgi:hypothetical protein
VLIEDELYKRGGGVAGVLMRCILGDQGRELLREIYADTWPENTCRKGLSIWNLLAHGGGRLQGRHRTTL